MKKARFLLHRITEKGGTSPIPFTTYKQAKKALDLELLVRDSGVKGAFVDFEIVPLDNPGAIESWSDVINKARIEAVPTQPGIALANKIAPAVGSDSEVIAICTLIARHALTYDGIQTAYCSYEMDDQHMRNMERRESRIEDRIRFLCSRLPIPTGSTTPIAPVFSGDPRGVTVKLAMPEPWTRLHDDWGRVGVCTYG